LYDGNAFSTEPPLKKMLAGLGYTQFHYRDFVKNGYKSLVKQKTPLKHYIIVAGGYERETKHAVEFINKTYNQPSNRYGDYIRIIIGSDVLNEGITLKSTRQTHLLYINNQFSVDLMDQVFGRSVRANSHDQLPEDERYSKRYVHVHTYNDDDMKQTFSHKSFNKLHTTYYQSLLTIYQDMGSSTALKKTLTPSSSMNVSDDEIHMILDMIVSGTKEQLRQVDVEDSYKTRILNKYKKLKELFIAYIRKKYQTNFSIYPYDMFTYLQAFHKYINTHKILKILANIAIDCPFSTKEIRCIEESCEGKTVDVVCTPGVSKNNDINIDTYRYEHFEGKIGYMIDVMKNLFHTRHVYTMNELKQVFQNTPPYIKSNEVDELIETVLTEMIPTPEVRVMIFPHTITNDGVRGYLMRKGDVVYFEPMRVLSYKKEKDDMITRQDEQLFMQEQLLVDLFTRVSYSSATTTPYVSLSDFYNKEME
jgi:hypothetical protein